MTYWGDVYRQNYSDPDLSFDDKLVTYYYDNGKVLFEIATYTGDSIWNTYAQEAVTFYREWIDEDWNAPGYWNFTDGLRMDWQRNGDTASRDGVISISTISNWCRDSQPDASYAGPYQSRDTSHAVLAHYNAEACGASHRSRTDFIVGRLFDYIDQWFISKTYRAPADIENYVPGASGKFYIQPFMVGLIMRALIRYWNATGDSAVLPAVKVSMDFLWDNAWVPADLGFWYQNWKDTPEDSWPVMSGASGHDVDLLISPAFLWLYHQTGDVTYRDKADQIFAGAVPNAYLSGGGKWFNQHYNWSFEYVYYRQQQYWTPTLEPYYPPF